MSKKFTAAVLATLIGAGLTAPAFAADAVAPAGKSVEQAAPKAKHDGAKVETKAKHEGQTAKNKTERGERP